MIHVDNIVCAYPGRTLSSVWLCPLRSVLLIRRTLPPTSAAIESSDRARATLFSPAPIPYLARRTMYSLAYVSSTFFRCFIDSIVASVRPAARARSYGARGRHGRSSLQSSSPQSSYSDRTRRALRTERRDHNRDRKQQSYSTIVPSRRHLLLPAAIMNFVHGIRRGLRTHTQSRRSCKMKVGGVEI